MDTTLREVECPVCLVTLAKDIYLCETGHSLCAECSKRNRKCPLCSYPMQKQKNYALEAVLQKLMTSNSSSPKFTKLNTTLIEAECPLCCSMFEGEIYLCETGHSLCAECSQYTQSCPLCRKRIGKQRNYALEAALPKLVTSKTSILKTVLTIYSPCPLDEEKKCAYSATNLDDLRTHLRDVHQDSFKTCCSFGFHLLIKNNKNLMGHVSTCRVYDVMKKLYKICVKINYDANLLWFAVQKVESTDDGADAFTVNYTLENLHRKKFSGKISRVTKMKNAFTAASYVEIPLNFFITRSVAGRIGIYVKLYQAAPGRQQ